MSARVAVIGANGYGVHHRRALVPLLDAGAAELVGLCDLAPVRDDAEAPVPAGARLFTDYRELLAATRPDVAIVATPPHTHLAIATAAARAGADILVEKPPLLSTVEHDALTRVLRETGRACQVGFQALGSAALAELVDAIRAGRLGRITGIGTYGGWQRPDSYYTRTAWAGRRELDGRPVLDGALANPFGHAVMQSLAVAEGCGSVSIASVELERYRARPIEVDDTGVLRVRLADDMTIVVAVTLCADEWVEPVLIVHAERGRAVLGYTQDTLQLPGEAAPREVPGRIGLLENLLKHRSEPGVDLLAPLERTAPFTAVVDAIAADGEPAPIDGRHLVEHGAGPDRVVTVPGVTGAVRDSAERLALPSELAVPWAARPLVPLNGGGRCGSAQLRVGGTVVAEYVVDPDVPAWLSPRPYLHPVRTLGGVATTDALPDDHPHHLGVSLAVQDVNRTNLWGGKTYVRGTGYAWLGDHGRIVHDGFESAADDRLAERLRWCDAAGATLLDERREIAARPLPGAPEVWVLDVAYTLTASRDVTLGSPATNGRPGGAGYGGFFWRAAGSGAPPEVFTAGATGEEEANGSAEPWLAMASASYSLVFTGLGHGDRWFVRAAGYPGVCVALAFERPLVIRAGESIARRHAVAVADGYVSREAAREWAASLSGHGQGNP